MLPSGLQSGVDQIIADQRSGAIMDDDVVRRIQAQALQAETYRVLPALATKPDVDRLAPAVALELPRHLQEVSLGNQQGDAGDLGTAVEGLERSADQGPASHRQQDPCAGLALMKPGSGSRDDGLYLHGSPLFTVADLVG